MVRVKRFETYGEAWGFKCPGCNRMHVLPVTGERGWEFNSNPELPTFNPSILTRYDYEDGDPKGYCHSFVTDGKIQFLTDCTHPLAGKTVELPEMNIQTESEEK